MFYFSEFRFKNYFDGLPFRLATLLTPAFKDDFENVPDLIFHLKELVAAEGNSDDSSEGEEDFFGRQRKGSGPDDIVKRYLADSRRDVKMLSDYPIIKNLHLKYCSGLSSSAPVERLFSAAARILRGRETVDDNLFEELLLLKLNPFCFNLV